ncbi:MarR family winged helix-turn-helix transcriptional regulator [Microbacterium sp. X-17]|uniref:MarR family winged helix-turn-helix transcriptional regulator n=1 Tax=Microbacterium sp. X-17 TaxID=3144404 RepID=UPI0031F4CA9E
MTDVPDDVLEAITRALGRMRMSRGPFGPGIPGPPFGPFGPGGPHPPWHRGRHRHEDKGEGPWEGPRAAGLARFRLLDALAGTTQPLSVSELAERIGVDQPRASRLVQQGVDHGFLRREADPADARRTLIALTDAGRTMIDRFRGHRRDQISQALAALTPAEQAELARLLTRVADAWPAP